MSRAKVKISDGKIQRRMNIVSDALPTPFRKAANSGGHELFGPIPEQFGRYRIERELGRGGMGAVYLAYDSHLHRRVALKIPFFDDGDSDAAERFYREARAMATVQHANLCPVYDVGHFGQRHYLTMAFVDGQPLSKMLRKSSEMSVIAVFSLFQKIAIAVQKAHEAGIVHRDLKPANIMITGDLEPVIMDFGLASRKNAGEAELTHSGIVLGSPSYMAPEQVEARHQDVGPATDVYAMGVILYQIITGRRPFEGSVASVYGQILDLDPEPPSKLNPELPYEVDALCLKALAKSPSDRHPSAASLAEDLARTILFLSDVSPTLSFVPNVRPPVAGSATVGSDGSSGLGSDAGSVSGLRHESELRQVTVAVFSFDPHDIAVTENFASRSSSPSELLQDQSKRFTTFVSERIGRAGGVIVVSSGAEVIACFGFPTAFEDASQRAVRVALEVMGELAGIQLDDDFPAANQASVVIHSGEAVAQKTERNDGISISLAGEARNTAARLNAIAMQGAIIISAATYERVAGHFRCERLDAQRIRGIAQPVNMFRVVKEAASRNRVELMDAGILTPLVGRETELTILKDRWEQTLDGLGQIVLLIGHAGLGKSRLVRELREHVLHEYPDEVTVVELRCSQFHQGIRLFPIAEFFAGVLDFEKHRTPQDRLAAVVSYLRELNLYTTENVAILCGLLGLRGDSEWPPTLSPPTLSPGTLNERTEDLLLQWFKQMASVRPVLLIVEDLHWGDSGTLDFVRKHVSEFQRGQLMSLLTFRPEFETPWKSKPYLTQIALNRLSRRQMGDMMRRFTKRRDIPDTIVQRVAERTEGIPLFVEEFTGLIVESGILDITDGTADAAALLNVIPVRLQDLLLSRLDRIAASREVLQLAATIGREFSFDLLAAASSLPAAELQRELDKLMRAEIVVRKGYGPEECYLFSHPLLQDTAYRLMLTGKRKDCHKRIAESLESRFADIVRMQPGLLAHHFAEAGITGNAS